MKKKTAANKLQQKQELEEVLNQRKRDLETRAVYCNGVGIQGENNTCNCPLDRQGSSCENYRPFVCNITLLSPPPQCKVVDPNLDQDPVCFVYGRKDAVTFEYTMNCYFTDTSNIPADNPLFNYYVKNGDQFAISRISGQTDPQNNIILKIFNFNILSDIGASIIVPLLPAQYIGDMNIDFNIQIGNIPDKYFAGGRLYFEVSLYTDKQWVSGLAKKSYDRRFIDAPDAPRRLATRSGLSGGAIAAIIIGVLGGIGLIAFGIFYLRRRAQKKLIREELENVDNKQ